MTLSYFKHKSTRPSICLVVDKKFKTNLRNWSNFPDMTVVVDYIIFIIKFPHCDQNDLYEWDELSADKPDVHQSHIGGWWQFFHHTSKNYLNCQRIWPKEQRNSSISSQNLYSTEPKSFHKIRFQPNYSAKLQNVPEHNFNIQIINLETILALA